MDLNERLTKAEKLNLYNFLVNKEFCEKVEILENKIVDFLNILIKDYIINKDVIDFLEKHPECVSLCNFCSKAYLDIGTFLKNLNRSIFYSFKVSRPRNEWYFNINAYPIDTADTLDFTDLLFLKCPKNLLYILCDLCVEYVGLIYKKQDFLVSYAEQPYTFYSLEDRNYFYRFKTWSDIYIENSDWYLSYKKYKEENSKKKDQEIKENIIKIENYIGL